MFRPRCTDDFHSKAFVSFTPLLHNPPAVQTDWERMPNLGIAEGATPVTAQAQEPSEQANLESVGAANHRRGTRF